MDRVLALHAGSRGFNSHRPMTERFFRSNRPGYLHPVSSELENSSIRVAVVIAVSLNVGGGICLIKPAKLCMCTQKHYKHNKDRRTHRTGCVWQWFRTAEPLGECCYENWNTHTYTCFKHQKMR